MPNRIIHERANTSETLASLDDGAERHFWRLIVQADDYGYLDARPEVIRARAYPMMLASVDEQESERRTLALTKVNLLHLFVTNGKRYGHFPSWDKYQQKRAKYSKFQQVQSCDSTCNQTLTDSFENRESEGRGGAPLPSFENRESRIENREPSKSPAQRGTRKEKRVTEITTEFIEQMVGEFKGRLRGEERTRAIIKEALAHKNLSRWDDKQVYLSGWLRRESEKEHVNGREAAPAGGFDNSHEKYVQAAKHDTPPLRSPSATPE